MKEKRSFSLLEVLIVLSLISMLSSSLFYSLNHLLAHHRFYSEVRGVEQLLEELQIEALVLQSDMTVHLYQNKGKWHLCSNPQEAILRQKSFSLAHVKQVTFNRKPQKELTIEVCSTGHVLPLGIVGLEGNKKKFWIDLRQPIQINCSKEYPSGLPLLPVLKKSTFLEESP